MPYREDLIAEATDLGLEFKGNISNVKLEELIQNFGEPPAVEEFAPPSPATKPDPESEDLDPLTAKGPSAARTPQEMIMEKDRRKRQAVAKAKKRAMETSVVTITSKDNRENDVTTTAYLSFENQYFGMSKNVPLDVPVELERALIEIAASCTMTLHKDLVVAGRRTGNKVPVTVKKYAISYSRQDPK
ncbi:MAG: hypothetical protein GY820_10495 [Gammaproteobacteria bacterium]|nr:hypothetical protein [Gammaproteobacteria bacterium]